MAIPTIEPYAMPTEAELPANTAGWTIDPGRAVLLIHDMQNYFLSFFSPDRPPYPDLVDNVATLRSAFRRCGAPVAYSAQPGDMSERERGLLKDFWGPGMSSEPAHRAILERIAPSAPDVVLTKWRPSAFCRTDLLELMGRAGRDQLVICGVYAHVGILMTAHEGYSQDIETFLVADAIADFSAKFHEMALTYVSSRCSVTLSTRQALAMVAGRS
jgi:bifunctional isochorismate lyase/aryl carrier protein